ncbi:cysteine and histidine-rich domain-containing protein 1-like [Antedon mediterranea]|uniref:cysteine and histidine-rich domain-containing protein 1-like n=1 Tax=Antedon mediterranea TaxID=105859 RepID=UPI003AF5E76F
MTTQESSGMRSLTCYNTGCGKQYNNDEDGPEACKFHLGGPIFHDAYKGWSCCKKRTTDFTEFLNIKGCAKGPHNPVKPVPQPTQSEKDEVSIKEEPKPPREPNPIKPVERPRNDEPLVAIPVTIGATLKDAIAKMQKMQVSLENNADSEEVKIGTACKRTSCGVAYTGPESNNETCMYHAGTAIFHEGMKYWSCCKKKTSNFDDFLKQAGCTKDRHQWLKSEQEMSTATVCRHDWHQTAGFAVLTVYCKVADPNTSTILTNQVNLQVHIAYDGGRSTFDRNIILEAAIDPAKSSVKMLGTKVEIKLKKLEGFSWKKYEIKEEQ